MQQRPPYSATAGLGRRGVGSISKAAAAIHRPPVCDAAWHARTGEKQSDAGTSRSSSSSLGACSRATASSLRVVARHPPPQGLERYPRHHNRQLHRRDFPVLGLRLPKKNLAEGGQPEADGVAGFRAALRANRPHREQFLRQRRVQPSLDGAPQPFLQPEDEAGSTDNREWDSAVAGYQHHLRGLPTAIDSTGSGSTMRVCPIAPLEPQDGAAT